MIEVGMLKAASLLATFSPSVLAVFLFAQTPPPEKVADQITANTQAVASAQNTALLAVAMAAVQGLFLWLGRREDNVKEKARMQFDTKLALMEQKQLLQDAAITALKDQSAACMEREKKLQGELVEDRAELTDLRRRLDERDEDEGHDRRRKPSDPDNPGPRRRTADHPPP